MRRSEEREIKSGRMVRLTVAGGSERERCGERGHEVRGRERWMHIKGSGRAI